MAEGTRPENCAVPDQSYPGHSLSIIEALHAVGMKLSQVDETRYVYRAPLVDSFEMNSFSSQSLILPTVRTFEPRAQCLSHSRFRSNLLSKQCLKH